MPELIWKGKALRNLDKFPRNVGDDLAEKIEELKKWPNIQHLKVEKLTDDKEKRHKLVIGHYRVLWKIIKGQPVVIEIHDVLRRTSTTYSKR